MRISSSESRGGITVVSISRSEGVNSMMWQGTVEFEQDDMAFFGSTSHIEKQLFFLSLQSHVFGVDRCFVVVESSTERF